MRSIDGGTLCYGIRRKKEWWGEGGEKGEQVPIIQLEKKKERDRRRKKRFHHQRGTLTKGNKPLTIREKAIGQRGK